MGCFSKWPMTAGGVAGQRARFSMSKRDVRALAQRRLAALPSRDRPERVTRARPSVRRMSSTRSSGVRLGKPSPEGVHRSATIALGKLSALGGLVDVGEPAPGQQALEEWRGCLLVAEQKPLDLRVLEKARLLPQRIQADRVAVMRGDEPGLREAGPGVGQHGSDHARRGIEAEGGQIRVFRLGRERLALLFGQRVQLRLEQLPVGGGRGAGARPALRPRLGLGGSGQGLGSGRAFARGERPLDRPLAREALQDGPQVLGTHAADQGQLAHARGPVDPREQVGVGGGEMQGPSVLAGGRDRPPVVAYSLSSERPPIGARGRRGAST